ncbi:MAG: hypothetical protein ACRD68_04110, partial [Pyrinomonadaceae bacterium]
MNAITQTRPKAFAILFRDLSVWSVQAYVKAAWQWPAEDVKPLRLALRRKIKKTPQTSDGVPLAT